MVIESSWAISSKVSGVLSGLVSSLLSRYLISTNAAILALSFWLSSLWAKSFLIEFSASTMAHMDWKNITYQGSRQPGLNLEANINTV